MKTSFLSLLVVLACLLPAKAQILLIANSPLGGDYFQATAAIGGLEGVIQEATTFPIIPLSAVDSYLIPEDSISANATLSTEASDYSLSSAATLSLSSVAIEGTPDHAAAGTEFHQFFTVGSDADYNLELAFSGGANSSYAFVIRDVTTDSDIINLSDESTGYNPDLLQAFSLVEGDTYTLDYNTNDDVGGGVGAQTSDSTTSQFILAQADAIPEPTILTMMAAGLGLLILGRFLKLGFTTKRVR